MNRRQVKRQTILLTCKLLILVVVSYFILGSFRSASTELAARSDFEMSDVRLRYLFVSASCYLAAMLPMALYFHQLNRAFGQRCQLRVSMRAHLIGHLGKYVPGKAMVVLLRTGFMQGEGIEKAVVAVAVFIETFTMLAVGAALAGCLIVWQFPDHIGLASLSALLFVGAVAPTWPPLLRWLLRRLRAKSWTESVAAALEGYRWKQMACGWALELTSLLLMSLSLGAVILALPNVNSVTLSEHSSRLVASTSLSMVAGFASLIPGGLGVREVVLDQLLKQPFGVLTAFAAPIILRVVWLLTELVVSGILYFGPSLRRSHD